MNSLLEKPRRSYTRMAISGKVGGVLWSWFGYQIKAESALYTMIPKTSFTQNTTCSKFCEFFTNIAWFVNNKTSDQHILLITKNNHQLFSNFFIFFYFRHFLVFWLAYTYILISSSNKFKTILFKMML